MLLQNKQKVTLSVSCIEINHFIIKQAINTSTHIQLIMKGLLSTTNSPAFNLATEEYLLRQTEEDVFFLYTNTPSIIVGKHQNTLAEINYQYINTNNIPIYRRLSGGGTVYHDEQNLNFCFIQSGKKGELVNFERYSEPILMALKELGIEATFGKRHDIQINGKKVSGNASHVYKNRVMHHGTLLFNSNLSILNNALKNNPLVIKDKAVKSVRSEVTNISDYLTASMSYAHFVQFVFDFLLQHYNGCDQLNLTNEAINQIEAISATKYASWEWNYGYSPNFELNRLYKLKNGIGIKSQIRVEKGIITECQLKTSDVSLQVSLDKIAKTILGNQHHNQLLKDILSSANHSHLTNLDQSTIIAGLFT